MFGVLLHWNATIVGDGDFTFVRDVDLDGIQLFGVALVFVDRVVKNFVENLDEGGNVVDRLLGKLFGDGIKNPFNAFVHGHRANVHTRAEKDVIDFRENNVLLFDCFFVVFH